MSGPARGQDPYVVLRHKDCQAIEARYNPVAWAGLPGTYHAQPESGYERFGPYRQRDLLAGAEGPREALDLVSDDIRRWYPRQQEGDSHEK